MMGRVAEYTVEKLLPGQSTTGYVKDMTGLVPQKRCVWWVGGQARLVTADTDIRLGEVQRGKSTILRDVEHSRNHLRAFYQVESS